MKLILLLGKQAFLKMNFFKRKCLLSQMTNIEQIAILASRIYFILLSVSLIVLTFFNGLNTVTVVNTVQLPSLSIFEKLQHEYPSTLSCPCQTIAVSYNEFLNVVPTYHQVSYVDSTDINSQFSHTMSAKIKK